VLIRASARLASADPKRRDQLVRDRLLSAQWAKTSEAGAAVNQMAARAGIADPKISSLVRERQDLVLQWQSIDKALLEAASSLADRRNAAAEQQQRARLGQIDLRIAEIDSILATEAPEYSALANPRPQAVSEIQADLRADEALIITLDVPGWRKELPEETYVWAITKTGMGWSQVPIGTKAIAERVRALRCGLDYEGSWTGDNAAECVRLLNVSYSAAEFEARRPLPFDVSQAYKLYSALFGAIDDFIKGKQLLIVPSGSLTSLPFQALVTENASSDLRKVS
jgi:hypothetical protein